MGQKEKQKQNKTKCQKMMRERVWEWGGGDVCGDSKVIAYFFHTLTFSNTCTGMCAQP